MVRSVFSGNRSNVEIALVCDSVGNGIVLLGERANISVEVINDRIVVSHNALLTGLSNKKTLRSGELPYMLNVQPSG